MGFVIESAQGKPSCSYGREWNYIYGSTVEPYGILNAKRALVVILLRDEPFAVVLAIHH